MVWIKHLNLHAKIPIPTTKQQSKQLLAPVVQKVDNTLSRRDRGGGGAGGAAAPPLFCAPTLTFCAKKKNN